MNGAAGLDVVAGRVCAATGRAIARAAPALMALVNTPGRFTAAFAVKGLGTSKATQRRTALRTDRRTAQRDPAPSSSRPCASLAAIRDASAVPVLIKIIADASADPTLRLEAANAFGALVTHRACGSPPRSGLEPSCPAIRAAALQALARGRSGDIPDRAGQPRCGPRVERCEWPWPTRSARCPAAQGLPRLTVDAAGPDQRVVPAVLARAGLGQRRPDVDGRSARSAEARTTSSVAGAPRRTHSPI